MVERFQASDVEAQPRRGRPAAIDGGVQIVPLQGVLTPQMGLLEMIFGIGGGLTSFRDSFQQAVDNPDVGAIVINVDSPGGLVDLIPETAQMVRSARDKKVVVAVANTLAASAAYWIASQASEMIITPSGEAGSIGVYMEHRDLSGALEDLGVKVTMISAGKFKTEGNPYEPLDTEAVAAFQQAVDDHYNLFVKDVATGRGAQVGAVRNGFGEGRVLTAKRAVDEGLVDRVDTLENVVTGLVRRSRSTSENGAALGAGEVKYSSEERERLVATLAGLASPGT